MHPRIIDLCFLCVRRDARDMLGMNMTVDNSKTNTMYDMLFYFDANFMPGELGGQLNVKGDGDELVPADNQSTTFSREFLESISLDNHFVMLPGFQFISLAAFVHLCR